jgi:6-pyruvoyltetrahydropterin/6-carboxytetrahydropterin synthase
MSNRPQRVTICRKISFSSGHRNYRSDLSEDENRELYGSSYSKHGHGHNYVLEAHVEGDFDSRTGMVMNLKDLDTILKNVTDPLDHHFLNYDVPYFRDIVPTTENLAAYCFQEIDSGLPSGTFTLRRIRLFEGNDLWVDVEGRKNAKGSGG